MLVLVLVKLVTAATASLTQSREAHLRDGTVEEARLGVGDGVEGAHRVVAQPHGHGGAERVQGLGR